jgi:hypothetical protein
MPIPQNKIIFSKNNPRRRYHAKILFLSGIFIFQIFLLS